MALAPWFRRTLIATGLMNLAGALTFVPSFPALRTFARLPDPGHPFYGWLLSLWILFFGLAYLCLAFAITPERLLLYVGAAGKASVSLLLVTFRLFGDLPGSAPLAGSSDLLFAVLFSLWLYQTRNVG